MPKLFQSRSKESNGKGNFVFSRIEDVATRFKISEGEEVQTKVFDIASPHEGRFRIDDELPPSRYLFLEFDGIHNSFYIGINDISFYDKNGDKIPFENIAVDGKDVDNENVMPAMPPNGWWAIAGEQHSLYFDFKKVVHVKDVFVLCTNASATPKSIRISNGKQQQSEQAKKYSTYAYFQLAGKSKVSPQSLTFRKTPNDKEKFLSCDEVVQMLNENPSENGFDSFLSEDGMSQFAFYQKGLRYRTMKYFLGEESKAAVKMANSLKIDGGSVIEDVAKRALTLQELRVVRSIIVSNCVKNKWKSSRDGKRLRPEDVNLYDLNDIVIKPLTKKRNCSFKELFSSGDTAPVYYVSHWWGERVLDFIQCCERHAMMLNLAPSEAKYWVCAYANRQHDLGTDLGTDPEQSSFHRAMGMAQGVLLIIDPHPNVYSRIWVDYELYTTTIKDRRLDMVAYSKGQATVLADEELENEAPFQRSRREQKFPFEYLSKFALALELYKGEASQEIDKVRILNVMRKESNLDDRSIIDMINAGDETDERYISAMEKFSSADWALRALFAVKAWSIALATEGQTVDNFYGFDLTEVVINDLERKSLVLDDLIALDTMTDEEFGKIIGVLSPSIEELVINVAGCQELSDKCLKKTQLPKLLNKLSLNFGYSQKITNEGVIQLAKKIPKKVEILELDVAPQKLGDGSWVPERYNDHLRSIASAIPSCLRELKLTTALCGEEDGSGVIELSKALPPGLTKLDLTFRIWKSFEGSTAIDLVSYLPTSLESFSLDIWGGDYFDDNDWMVFTTELSKLANLKQVYIFTSDLGQKGFYMQRTVNSVDELRDIASNH